MLCSLDWSHPISKQKQSETIRNIWHHLASSGIIWQASISIHIHPYPSMSTGTSGHISGRIRTTMTQCDIVRPSLQGQLEGAPVHHYFAHFRRTVPYAIYDNICSSAAIASPGMQTGPSAAYFIEPRHASEPGHPASWACEMANTRNPTANCPANTISHPPWPGRRQCSTPRLMCAPGC